MRSEHLGFEQIDGGDRRQRLFRRDAGNFETQRRAGAGHRPAPRDSRPDGRAVPSGTWMMKFVLDCGSRPRRCKITSRGALKLDGFFHFLRLEAVDVHSRIERTLHEDRLRDHELVLIGGDFEGDRLNASAGVSGNLASPSDFACGEWIQTALPELRRGTRSKYGRSSPTKC